MTSSIRSPAVARSEHPPAEDDADQAEDKLIATEAGWICPCCDYTQNWAHKFMAGKKQT